jgi:phosphoglycolate phosphatase
MKENRTVLWDFNGTLLDDTRVCIDAINILLKERNKEGISAERYREIFTFPVKDYYSLAGFTFDEEPFEKPAIEFIRHYERMITGSSLFEDVKETLEELHRKNYRQMILSAMQQDFLNVLVERHSIGHYFEKIAGIGDHYADGKLALARQLVDSLGGERTKVTLIGDTLHDHEVGSALGIEVILVGRGHQSEKRLRETGRPVVHNLAEARKMLEIHNGPGINKR